MRRLFLPGALLAAGLILLLYPVSAIAANPDYDRAVEITRQKAEALRSYELQGVLQVENHLPGQAEPMAMELQLHGAARWPDRLLSVQQSAMFSMHLGMGPQNAWFHLGQAGACFVGEVAEMSRLLENAGQMELEEDRIFNFYSGISSFLLAEGLEIEPETGAETLTVGGREIACQIFREAGGSEKESKEFWFDPATGLVMQAELKTVVDQQGKQIEQHLAFRLENFSLDGDVAEDLFAYTPPAGVRVVPSLDRVMNPDALTGQPAVDVTFTDYEGNPVKLSDYRGKVVFLDFWATWCGPCRMEMPHLQKLHEELGASGEVVFLGASSEPKATVEGFLAKNPYTFKMVQVKQEDAQKKFKVTSIPAGFVIDREGVIRAHLIGAQSERQLRNALARAGVE